jgi:transposase
VVNQPRGQEIHVIADNPLGAQEPAAQSFLDTHENVHPHFTPTYSSWLNQVELWFSKIARDIIARGVFTSLADLKRNLMRYIRHYNHTPKTIKWKYFDPTDRISRYRPLGADLDGGGRQSYS